MYIYNVHYYYIKTATPFNLRLDCEFMICARSSADELFHPGGSVSLELVDRLDIEILDELVDTTIELLDSDWFFELAVSIGCQNK